MDALTLIIALALVGAALALILYPLWQQSRPEAILRTNPAGQTLEEYQARYQAALAAIRDLMFDYEMGKVAAEDYEPLLNRAKLEAATIRRQLDRLAQGDVQALNPALDAEIEAQVAQLRRKPVLNGNEVLLSQVEAEIELLKTLEADGAAEDGVCPHCGKPFQAGDAFCGRCGQPLARAVPPDKATVCPQCGYSFQPGDAFCVRCGTALETTPAQAVSRAG